MSPRPCRLLVPGLLLGAALLGGCSGGGAVTSSPGASASGMVSTDAPVLGACRRLSDDDVDQPSDDSAAVACTGEHSAETYAVGPLPAGLADAAYDDPRLGRFAYHTCGDAFEAFLGADESQVLRSLLTWAWFRPSPEAWAAGARWYRCDVVADGLPTTARGLLQRADATEPDRWMTCVDAPTITGARVPCSAPHIWRAVTTIVLGVPGSAWPGERVAEARSKRYCSSSVGAWLGYPPDYDYGYSVFGAGEWSAGNRRSVCWARTAA